VQGQLEEHALPLPALYGESGGVGRSTDLLANGLPISSSKRDVGAGERPGGRARRRGRLAVYWTSKKLLTSALSGLLILLVFLIFRSDTITMPTDEMFDLMRFASRGDDVYGVRSAFPLF
jgi:hypothetical protein